MTRADHFLATLERSPILDLLLLSAVALPCVVPSSQVEAGPIVCPFRAVTGLMCPGCGLTRSFVAIGHLDFMRSVAHHPFGPPLYVLLIALVAFRAAQRLCGISPVQPSSLWKQPAVRRQLILPVVFVWISWAVFRLCVAT